MNLFNKFLNLGTKEKFSSSDNKRIVLTNNISIIFSIILLMLSIVIYLKMNALNASLIFFALFVFLFLIPLFNKLGLSKITSLIISVLIPAAVVFSSTYIKINNEGKIDLITYIAPRIFLLATFVIPLITINYKKYLFFYSAILINLALLIGYNEIQNFFDVGIENGFYNKNTFFIVNITSFLSFFAIFISFIHFQKTNNKYEKNITEQNKSLKEFNEVLSINQKETEKLNQEFLVKSLEAEQARIESEKNLKELLLQQDATEKLNQEIFTKSLEAEQAKHEALKARQELENSTALIRSQAALSEILRNVTGKERSIEQFLQDALDKLLSFSWLNILQKGSISIIDDSGKNIIVAEKNLDDKKNDTEIQEIELPLKMADLTFGTLKIYKRKNIEHTQFINDFFNTLCETIASVINRKKTHNEIEKTKTELEKKNKNIRKYLVQIEQRSQETESLNQLILAQKKQVTEKNKEVEKRKIELEEYAKQLEAQAKEQEALYQQLFAQNMEGEQRKIELEEYSKQLEAQAKEQEALNQKLFAQNMEAEQQKVEVERYSKQLEEQSKEQEKLNQKLFAQNMEVEQRNYEIKNYSKQLEEQAKEQEKLNQKLFAQKLEVEQRNHEIEIYSKQQKEQAKEQEKLNQKLFAQNMEVEQRNFEIKNYSKEVEILKQKSDDALKHLSDSINYSKYIQDSLLPDSENIDERIPGEFFIYYKPKETIGGDFYYVNKINDYLILGVADCTGHGVPGALITMLGITFLDDIVDRNLADNTGEALNILRERIKRTFKSYGKSIKNKNGLDIAFCAINLKTNVMQFSGAFSPMYIYRNEELIEYKATRNPIGYYPIEKEFITNEIQLQKDDVIYLFSDGYPDQLGGEHERKFTKRQFKDLLFEIHKYPMSKQNIFVEKIMQKWMGNQPQVDDITLMGIKWENEIKSIKND